MNKKETNKDTPKEKQTKNAQKDILMSYMPYLIIIFFVLIIRIFICTPVRVHGSSMFPTLKNGDFMLLYKLKLRTKGVNRFDIVVLNSDDKQLIKRVIGLPGETIKYRIEKNSIGDDIGVLYINDEKIEEDFINNDSKYATCMQEWSICVDEYVIPDDEYFVMGDNRGNSTDSRILGSIKKSDIKGIAKLRFFPFNKIGNVK